MIHHKLPYKYHQYDEIKVGLAQCTQPTQVVPVLELAPPSLSSSIKLNVETFNLYQQYETAGFIKVFLHTLQSLVANIKSWVL